MSDSPSPPPTGIIALSPCALLEVAGEDRLRFMNGQVTNDVRLAEEGQAIQLCILNAKGQLDAVAYLRTIAGGYLLDAPLDLRESLPARLDRYLIADDVSLTDVSEDWYLVHALGLSKEDLQPHLPPGSLMHPCQRYGVPGLDLLSPTAPEFPAELLLPPAEVERFRIGMGVPLWPTELTPGLLPPEAGLDRTAISYDKGCYLGQEVISRMKRAGKTNRHLVLLEVPAGTAPGPLLAGDQDAGLITSVAQTEDGQTTLALGYRKRKFEDHSELTCSGSGQPAMVLKRLA